jgi:hypothetical protein
MKNIKTILIIALIFGYSYPAICQSNCYEKFLNCKETTIELFRNNNQSNTDKLTDQIVEMQICDPALGEKYTNWYNNFVESYKENLDSETANLKNEKAQLAQEAANTKKNMYKNLETNIQDMGKNIETNTKNKNSKTNGMSQEDYDALHPYGAGSIR